MFSKLIHNFKMHFSSSYRAEQIRIAAERDRQERLAHLREREEQLAQVAIARGSYGSLYGQPIVLGMEHGTSYGQLTATAATATAAIRAFDYNPTVDAYRYLTSHKLSPKERIKQYEANQVYQQLYDRMYTNTGISYRGRGGSSR